MAHQIVTIAGLKGGVGKSAMATNLAAFWAAAGRRVLLVDADPNGSASKLYRRGEGQLLANGSDCIPIQQAPMAMAKPWDLVLVDTAGGSRDEQRTYAEGSHFVIAPCQPAASSVEQVIELAELLKSTGKRFGIVLTMCDQRRSADAVKIRQLLESIEVPVLSSQITLLSAWPKAEAMGVAVRDARTDNNRPDAGAVKAWQQITELAKEIEQQMEVAQ